MELYAPIKSRKRIIASCALGAIIAVTAFGGTGAYLSGKSEQDGNDFSGRAAIGIEWLTTGTINAVTSPGEAEQTFPVKVKNSGNIAINYAFYPTKTNVEDYSPAMLDNTRVIVKFPGYVGVMGDVDMSLREYLTTAIIPTGNAFSSSVTLDKNEELEVTVVVRPDATAAEWSEADLGEFNKPFTTVFDYEAVSNGSSNLAEYAKKNGKAHGFELFTIPVSDVDRAIADGVHGSSVAD